jgi:hypothetical protein
VDTIFRDGSDVCVWSSVDGCATRASDTQLMGARETGSWYILPTVLQMLWYCLQHVRYPGMTWERFRLTAPRVQYISTLPKLLWLKISLHYRIQNSTTAWVRECRFTESISGAGDRS